MPMSDSTKDTRNRYERLLAENDDHPDLRMPKIDNLDYIISLFHDVGPASSGMGGLIPISWQEIQSWLIVNRLKLSTWEISLIRKLSKSYVSEFNLSSGKNSPPPYQDASILPNREEVVDKLKSALFSFKKGK